MPFSKGSTTFFVLRKDALMKMATSQRENPLGYEQCKIGYAKQRSTGYWELVQADISCIMETHVQLPKQAIPYNEDENEMRVLDTFLDSPACALAAYVLFVSTNLA